MLPRKGRPPLRTHGVLRRVVGFASDAATREHSREAAPAEPSTSGTGGGVSVEREASHKPADNRPTPAKPQSPYVDEMAAMLDPNQPPSVVLTFSGWADELGDLPSVEDYLRVDPRIRPVGESSDDSSDDSSDTEP